MLCFTFQFVSIFGLIRAEEHLTTTLHLASYLLGEPEKQVDETSLPLL